MNKYKSELREAIIKGDAKEIQIYLLELTEELEDSKLCNEAVTILNWHKQTDDRKRLGLISTEGELIERNKVIDAILSFIDKLPNNYDTEKSDSKEKPLTKRLNLKRNKYKPFFGTTILLMVIFLLLKTCISKKNQAPYNPDVTTNTKDSTEKTPITDQEPQTNQITPKSDSLKVKTPRPTTNERVKVPKLQEHHHPTKNTPKINLAKIISKKPAFDLSKKSLAVIDKDSIPLARIDNAHKIDLEDYVLVKSCNFTFTLKNIFQKEIIIDNIYTEILEYQDIEEYETVQELGFSEAHVAYILIGKMKRPYPIKFYIIGEERKDFGKIHVDVGSSETITVQIGAAEPGIYTFRCYMDVTTEDQEQRIELINTSIWLFDHL